MNIITMYRYQIVKNSNSAQEYSVLCTYARPMVNALASKKNKINNYKQA